MGKQRDRERRKFEVDGPIDLAALQPTSPQPDEEEAQHPRNREYTRTPQTRTRKAQSQPKTKRLRRPGRKNTSLSNLDMLTATLRDPVFFATAAMLDLPPGKRGPRREYNVIQFYLYLRMRKHMDSWRDVEAFFRHPIIHALIQRTLQETWPHHLDRRVEHKPMSRSQFDRHRDGLRTHRPEALAEAKRNSETAAHRQSKNQGYFPAAGSSLANPAPGSIIRGDGGFIKAMFDASPGDKVVDPITAEVQQARHDPDGYLGLDDNDRPNPGYHWVVASVTDAAEIEQETVLLGFERATAGGEAKAAPELIERLAAAIGSSRHYLYDMALQGEAIDRLYKAGLHPIVKVARGKGDSVKNALIEVKNVKGNDDKTHKVQIYGVDGVAFISVSANGKTLGVPLTPVAVRDKGGGRVLGEYKIPDDPTVHRALVGARFMIRLDGTTVDGRKRAQTLRWINEHTAAGGRLIPQRNTTESVFSKLERLLGLGGRALSVGEFNNTLDLLAYCEQNNLEAALAHERRTGRDPIGLGPPVPLPQLVAA